jgi:hypothetical protein
MISKSIRDRLEKALLRVPGADEKPGRDTLLIGIQCESFTRHAGNPTVDVQLIIARLENAVRLEDDRWYQLEDMWVETHRKQQNPAYLAQPYLFDLREPVKNCLFSLPSDPGLYGFVLPTPTDRLLQHFSNKLRHRGIEINSWARKDVEIAFPCMIDVRHTSVEDALSLAKKRKRQLEEQTVVWAVFMQDVGDARALWERLAQEFSGKLAKHFIVVFGLPPNVLARRTKPPKAMFLLPQPKCTAKDVSDWVGSIINGLKWQEASLIERWSRVIMTGNIESQEGLLLERLFDRLEYHRNQLTEHPTEEAFKKRLIELEQIGE